MFVLEVEKKEVVVVKKGGYLPNGKMIGRTIVPQFAHIDEEHTLEFVNYGSKRGGDKVVEYRRMKWK